MSSALELPHELLMRRYGLKTEQLSSHTQQLKKDLDKTITLIVNKSRNGQIQITPATQSKIDTYDRYICDGIFEYLEDKEVITETQSDSLENQMDSKRDEVVGGMKTTNETTSSTSNQQQSQQTPPPPASENSESKVKIGGFWDWQ
jgi:hypothetical protein